MPRAFLKAREPFSSYSHFIGAVLSGAGLFVLLVRLLFDSSVTGSLAAAAVVFCLSLIALYSASSVYHFSGRGEAVLRRLKKLDHSMIYVLIAGSYTRFSSSSEAGTEPFLISDLCHSSHPSKGKRSDDGYLPPCLSSRYSTSLGGGQPARTASRRKREHSPGLK